MKYQSKVQLSSFEMELINNTEWILTKNGIIEKVKQLLVALQEDQNEYLHSLSNHFPKEVLKTPAKISKGENYKGLPYLILDFPRCFDQENIFAIRTMFWWGNFFSITLQLAGNYKIMFEKKIISAYEILKQNGFFICVHEKQWEHHFENNNYVLINNYKKDDFADMIKTNSFIKLADKTSLQKWDDAQEILQQQFKLLIDMIIL